MSVVFSQGLNVPDSVGIQQHLLRCAARRGPRWSRWRRSN